MKQQSLEIFEGVDHQLPVIFDSPHSSNQAPPNWHPIAPPEALLTRWDAYVDELFGDAPRFGCTLLRADFPRYFIDLNRRRDDIDPSLVDGVMPFKLAPSSKSEVGMGLLRRLALPGVPVYADPIPASTLMGWITDYYDPYHKALADKIEEMHARFGRVRHIDCHSMKSRGNAMNDDAGKERPDFVVSDRDGTTADPEFTSWLADQFRDLGYSAKVNDPYKGAELIVRHGNPARNIHSVQIEVNRGIYMNESTFSRGTNFDKVRGDIAAVIGRIAERTAKEI